MTLATLTPVKLGIALLIVLLPLLIVIGYFCFSELPSSDNPLFLATLAKKQLEKKSSFVAPKKLEQSHQSIDSFYSYYTDDVHSGKSADSFLAEFFLPDKCRQKILFVTGNVDSLAQADTFRTQFKQDKRLASLPICIHELTWFDHLNLECEENMQSGRLSCNLALFANQLKSMDFTHLVIFAEQGKANVNNGIMFLDSNDSYDVFVHELAHFSGFIDEYPLSQKMVKRICAGVDAPNMVFRQTEKSEVNRQYWETLGLHNDIDISVARTCDNHPAQAFKASNRLTFMEYHDVAFIPQQYIVAWQKQLLAVPRFPSAHLNFAQVYEESEDNLEGQFWRSKYQLYLNSKSDYVTQ